MKFTDAKFTQDPETCRYELTLDENGDINKTNSFETALLLSFFCERRASVTEVPEIFRRRGWIGNINRPVEYGSKLWILSQSRLTADTVNRARTYIEQALEWLIDFDYLDQITVSTTQDINEIIRGFTANNCFGVILRRDLESQALLAEVVLIIEGSEQLRRNIILWQNTTSL